MPLGTEGWPAAPLAAPSPHCEELCVPLSLQCSAVGLPWLWKGSGSALAEQGDESCSAMCLWAGAGCGTTGPCFERAPSSPAVTLCPFLSDMMADNLAASVGCEDAPPWGTRLHWEKLGEFSKLILHAVGFSGEGEH